MFTTYNQYFDIHGDYQVLINCAKDLGNNVLLRELLTMSSTIDGPEITRYARIVQNIAIAQDRMDIVGELQLSHLVN